jgi:hypothetical protein
MVVVVAQPTANANRAVTLIMLNEFRICFMILGSFQVALFLICYRRPLAGTYATHSPLGPSELMPSNTHSCPRASCRTVGLWSYYTLPIKPAHDRQKRMAGLGDKNAARRDARILRTEATAYLFSAKGAEFSASLGPRPRIRGTPKQRQR